MKMVYGTLLVAALSVAVGCEGNIATAPETANMGGGSAPSPPEPAPPGDPKQAAKAEMAAPTESEEPAEETPEVAAVVTPEPAAEATAQPAAGDGGTSEVATAASGKKGRDYGGPGFVTTPIQEYFRAESRINLLHMANTMKIYKAGHGNKGPKTHEEFMDVIVKENGIQLPELPAGDEYAYDPKTEQLMVKHPAK